MTILIPLCSPNICCYVEPMWLLSLKSQGSALSCISTLHVDHLGQWGVHQKEWHASCYHLLSTPSALFWHRACLAVVCSCLQRNLLLQHWDSGWVMKQCSVFLLWGENLVLLVLLLAKVTCARGFNGLQRVDEEQPLWLHESTQQLWQSSLAVPLHLACFILTSTVPCRKVSLLVSQAFSEHLLCAEHLP